MADTLTPFIETLARTAVPILLGLVVIGGVLGFLCRKAENGLVRRIRRWRKRGGRASPNGPSSTASPPACPTCNSQMVLRRAGRGPYEGTRFWGCSRYPKCQGKRQESK